MNHQADCFRKQLLLHRYAELIQRVGKAYNLNETQIRTLQEKILRIDWFQYAECDHTVRI